MENNIDAVQSSLILKEERLSEVGSFSGMGELVMQRHLVHYKHTTETTREELAALQYKHQSVHSQLLDARTRLVSQEAVVQELRDAIEGYKETSARQASLVSSLRERVQNTEQEMAAIASSKTLTDVKLQTLAKQNQEVTERELQLDVQSKEYLSGWNRTKQEASDSQRRYQDLTSRLADRMAITLAGSDDPADSILSWVDVCCAERDRQKAEISVLEERVKSHEVESKAGRETVMRLVAEAGHEQTVSAHRAKDLDSARLELDGVLLMKRSVDADIQGLRGRLQANELALAASKQEAGCLERRSLDLDSRLRSSQGETRASQGRLQAFLREAGSLLGGQPASAPPSEEHVLERLEDLRSREESSRAAVLEMETKLSQVSEEMARQTELHQGVLQRAQQAEQQVQHLQDLLQGLEAELQTAGVHHDGLSHDKQHYLRFLEELSEKMKIDRVATDLGFDMRLEAILSRAGQLMRQEGVALVESKTLTHSLQRKAKAQRERLESKELHTELLRRKVAQLEEERRSRSALADAAPPGRKLQRKVERLQAELGAARLSNTELKARLAGTTQLQITVMEQNQTIEERTNSLSQLEKSKAKMEKRLAAVKSELQDSEQKAREEQQQAQRLLQTHAAAVTELARRERELADFRAVASQMLGLDGGAACLPNHEVIKRLEALVHVCHHHLHLPLACPHHPHQHHQHAPPVQDGHARSTGAGRSPRPGPEALPPPST